MDPAFEIGDAPREGAWDGLADLPLVTLAWRAARADLQARAAEREEQAAALARLGGEVFRLGRLAATLGDEPAREDLRRIAGRMEEALRRLELTLVGPEGAPFEGDLLEVLENVAQRPDPSASEPRVAEVIEPAILYRGALLRMGKVVVAVPGPTSGAPSPGGLPAQRAHGLP